MVRQPHRRRQKDQQGGDCGDIQNDGECDGHLGFPLIVGGMR
jgi:hypothetical protein